MKYVVEFISKIKDDPSRNSFLIFGETDIKSIAELCFEYGSKGWFNGVRVKKIKKRRNQMAKALKCDRCGQFYDYIKCLRKYQIHDMDEKNFNKTVDLCPDCYEIFTKWLTGEKPQSDLANSEYGTGELYPGEFKSRHYEFEEDSE